MCQYTRPATPCATGRRLNSSLATSWDNGVWSVVLESCVWEPHSLHTAEATGSKPVTPTSKRVPRTLLRVQLPADCQHSHHRFCNITSLHRYTGTRYRPNDCHAIPRQHRGHSCSSSDLGTRPLRRIPGAATRRHLGKRARVRVSPPMDATACQRFARDDASVCHACLCVAAWANPVECGNVVERTVRYRGSRWPRGHGVQEIR
jgi:hypothetical protein